MGAIRQGTNRLDQWAGYSTLEAEVCAACGVLFAAPEHMLDARRQDGQSFYCPNGHSLTFGEREIDKVKRNLQAERDKAARLAAQRDQAEASARAQKAAATRARNQRDRDRERVRAGVCPCCNRTFKNLARHMERQHPDFGPVGEHDDAGAT